MNKIKIASRKSALALYQADYVKNQLMNYYSNLDVEIVAVCTIGDKILDGTLLDGGKGMFIKDLEVMLLEGKADIAVHSVKDMPTTLNKEFELVAVTQRSNPLDSFISNKYTCLESMPQGSVVGTSSLRRQSQIRAIFPKIIVNPLRGNVNTRLKKLDEKRFDAIILAACGLQRLNLLDRINLISEDVILPAVGQGALGIEILKEKKHLKDMLKFLNHTQTAFCVHTERIFSRLLGGSCNTPIAGYAKIINNNLKLQGVVAKKDGSLVLKSVYEDKLENFQQIASKVANNLIDQGALKIINSVNI